MKKTIISLLFTLYSLISAVAGATASHPSLLLTRQGVKEIRANREKYPLFKNSLAEVLAEADRALAEPVAVPVPRDGGGGATHEQHKTNYYSMYYCGIAYQLTGARKYADYVDRMLGEYAVLYPTLGEHPVKMSSSPGRLFWQSLNEYVWTVHVAIAYDCVHDALPAERRAYIERTLFVPLVEFITNGSAKNREIFNMMHNHGTWATAAVGMLGMAADRAEWVNEALYGTDLTGKNGGFLMQLEQLFSPDGYFTEGAYYLRYAIWSFVLFAASIEHNLPQIDIFHYNNSVLEKAVGVLVQLAYEGKIMMFNDALEKRYSAQEIIAAVDILYAAAPQHKELLTIARDYQQKVLPTDAGFAVARDIARGQAQPVRFVSAMYRDGADGSEGGVGIMRWNSGTSALTLKATSHGLSHGHYDKLTIAYYDNGNEVLTDYGAVRFINIEAKNKGHYTRENKTWAMTTIAHNTVTVDEGSDFGGDIEVSSRYHSDVYYADFANRAVQILSAKDEHAYEGVQMHRTVLEIETDFLQYPLIVDIFRVMSDNVHKLDFPFWFAGQVISTDFPYSKALDGMSVMGTAEGYRHLWVEAEGRPAYTKYNADPTGETCRMSARNKPTACFTWLVGDRFYTLTTLTTDQTELRIVRLGANDPDFNLRPQQGLIITEPRSDYHTFLSTIETHGIYDLQVEQTANATSSVATLELIYDCEDYTVAVITFVGGQVVTVYIANQDNSPTAQHTVEFGDGEWYTWQGVYSVN